MKFMILSHEFQQLNHTILQLLSYLHSGISEKKLISFSEFATKHLKFSSFFTSVAYLVEHSIISGP